MTSAKVTDSGRRALSYWLLAKPPSAECPRGIMAAPGRLLIAVGVPVVGVGKPQAHDRNKLLIWLESSD